MGALLTRCYLNEQSNSGRVSTIPMATIALHLGVVTIAISNPRARVHTDTGRANSILQVALESAAYRERRLARDHVVAGTRGLMFKLRWILTTKNKFRIPSLATRGSF